MREENLVIPELFSKVASEFPDKVALQELNIPVVPVYIKGSHQSWPRGRRLPRLYPLKVIFGRPLLAKELLERKGYTGDDYEIIARDLRGEVRKLVC